MNYSFDSGPPHESKTHSTTSLAGNEAGKISFLARNHRTQVKSAVIGSNVSNQCAGARHPYLVDEGSRLFP